MNIKVRFVLFLFIHLFATQLFAAQSSVLECCKLEIVNPDDHRVTCISFSAASGMAALLAAGFTACAVTHQGLPAVCAGNAIAAGCTGSAACVLVGCAVRQHTLMQVSERQGSTSLQRLLVPSQQSMALSPDSRQEGSGFRF